MTAHELVPSTDVAPGGSCRCDHGTPGGLLWLAAVLALGLRRRGAR